MSIHIQARGFALTEPLKQHTLRRIQLGLGEKLDNIGNVRVGLSDINGPKGGPDKCCRVHISLRQQRDVVVEDTQPDMYKAISRAVRRASRVLGRRLSKLRARSNERNTYGNQKGLDTADAAV